MLELALDRTPKGLDRLTDEINNGLSRFELILDWIDKDLNRPYS